MTQTFKKQSSASVGTPDTGYARAFVDSADSLLKVKDDSGTVYPAAGSVAQSLGTTGNPVTVDGAGPPAALGDLLMATAIGGSPEAQWLPPVGNMPFLDMVNVPKIDDGDSPFSALPGTCIPVDLSGAAANVEVNLPTAASSVGRELWVKLVSAVGLYKVTLEPAGADTIDGEASYDMDTDYEWIKLRAIDLGGGVYMWCQFS